MNVEQLAQAVERAFGLYQAKRQQADTLTAEVNELTESVNVLTLADVALSQLLTEVSRENVQAIEQTITYGLRTVFDNLQLSFKFEQGSRGGAGTLEPRLVDGHVEASITEAFGGGPAQVVAFLLRLIVCYRLGLYPVVLLDEIFSMVSREYVPNVAKLLRELAAQLNMTLLLVTHQEEFTEHANRAYQVRETPGGTTFALVSTGTPAT